MLKLAISTGWTIEYVESLPITTIRELQGLNQMSPFLYEEQSRREAIIATLIYNQKVTKKAHLKSVTDLFPYTKGGIPEEYEDEIVLKARRILNSISSMSNLTKGGNHAMDDFIIKVREQIKIEEESDALNMYRVRRLKQMLEQVEKPTEED